MSVLLQEFIEITIEQEISRHPSWIGHVSGLKAEKILKGRKKPYQFVLRAGELQNDYYVSFILPDFSIKHTPFTITMTAEGWYYENTGGGGPYTDAMIDDVLHLIMHCHKNECSALVI